jgi:bacterioferritin-associated ferredoxin
MIVCSCNRITERELRQAARAGAPCLNSAYAHLGCEVKCGGCVDFAQEVVDEERSELLSVESRAA